MGTMRYRISGETERNGYHDSDWYVWVYDTETDTIEHLEVGTTRFYGCLKHGAQVCYACRGITDEPMPPEVREKAEKQVREHYYNRKLAAELKPVIGWEVVTTKAATNRPREEVSEPCKKCNGTGKWINPQNPKDIRVCFGCKGSGEVKRSKAGKGKAVKIPVGTRGKLLRVFENRSKYGSWDYGSTAIVQREDGGTFRIKLSSLENVVDRAEIRRQAEGLDLAARESENLLF